MAECALYRMSLRVLVTTCAFLLAVSLLQNNQYSLLTTVNFCLSCVCHSNGICHVTPTSSSSSCLFSSSPKVLFAFITDTHKNWYFLCGCERILFVFCLLLDCGPKCSSWYNSQDNGLTCNNITSLVEVVKCVPPITSSL